MNRDAKLARENVWRVWQRSDIGNPGFKSVSSASGLTPIRIIHLIGSFRWGVLTPSPVICFDIILEPRLRVQRGGGTKCSINIDPFACRMEHSPIAFTSPTSQVLLPDRYHPLTSVPPSNMPPVKGQTVVIIGGSSGIGAAAAKLACVEGVKVAIASSNQTRVDEAVKKMQTLVPGAQISGLTVDISGYDMESHLEKLFTDVTEANGGQIDHIILTAGLANVKPVSEFTAEYFKEAAPL